MTGRRASAVPIRRSKTRLSASHPGPDVDVSWPDTPRKCFPNDALGADCGQSAIGLQIRIAAVGRELI